MTATITPDALLDTLRIATAGLAYDDREHPAHCANALVSRVDLTPADPAGKVSPPTYSRPDGKGSTYVLERRRADTPDGQVDTVLLDSIAAQANRIELALLAAQRVGQVELPVLTLDMGERFGTVTALDLPHRCYDAYIIDSLHDGQPFAKSVPGRELGVGQWRPPGREHDASGLLAWCPTALTFGSWDSHAGRRAIRAASFPRALTCEIVGDDPREGRRAAGRMDPYNIASQIKTYEDGDGRMILDAPSGKAKVKKPSKLGYGNIAPTINDPDDADDSTRGGVTVTAARQAAVLSFPALRRLRFPHPDGTYATDAEHAARTALAALAVYGLALHLDAGYDLRSGCLLVPADDPTVTLIGRTAQRHTPVTLNPAAASAALDTAIGEVRAAGLTWQDGIVPLTPREDQTRLVEETAELRAAGAGGDDE